jgi:hypothetical protein
MMPGATSASRTKSDGIVAEAPSGQHEVSSEIVKG